MDLVQVIMLALIQGITEFLPVSSSAHLILPSQLLGWPDQGLAFDVAVHVGTLTAVVAYFRKDISNLTVAWFGQFGKAGPSEDSRLAWGIIIATIPVCICGLLGKDFIEANLRSIAVIATTTVVFGLLLWFADAKSRELKTLKDMTLLFALVVGLAQAIALIPGTSRSGITMTMALLLGFTRVDAARFSFLLSIPTILLGGGYAAVQLFMSEGVDWLGLAVGFLTSMVSAYLCIYYFLSFISKMGMLPFVVYRLILGGFLLFIWAY